MSRKSKRKHEAGLVASGARATRQMAAQVKPLARSTGAATARRVHKTRAWAAPQVERAGHVLQDSVAPRVSSRLSSAARRLEPARPRSERWRKLALAGGSALTAAAGAVAALVRSRRKPDTETSAAEMDADDVTPAAQMGNGQARTGADAKAERPARTS
ncbi:MAG TPA: hypothetical protein VH307_11355 [Streptosporangiaceae bacterium]|jgi:hypothetical protein|nr:hypothetical protein [Streptosporangiaceae bacterium]